MTQVLRSSRPHVALVAAVALHLLAAPAPAQSWRSATGGYWYETTRWNGGVPNSSTADATIAASGSPYTVRLTDSRTVNSLTIDSPDATLLHTAGTLTVGQGVTVARGTYHLNGGTIAGGTIGQRGVRFERGTLQGTTVLGDLAVERSGVFRGAAIQGNLVVGGEGVSTSLRLEGGTTVGGDITSWAQTRLGQELTVRDGQTFNAHHGVFIESDGQLQVATGGVLTTGGDIYFGGDVRFENRGVINAEGDYVQIADYSGDGAFANFGTLNVGGDTYFVARTNFTNETTGVINLRGVEEAYFDYGWNNAGTINVDAASVLTLSGDYSAANVGTIDIAEGGIVRMSGRYENGGTDTARPFAPGDGWVLGGGTIVGGAVDATAFGLQNGTLSGVAVVGDVRLTGGGNGLQVQDGTTFSGDIFLDGGTLTPYQDLSIGAGQTLRIERGGELSIGESLSTAGEQHTVTIAAGGEVLLAGGYIRGRNFSPATLVNEGRMRVAAGPEGGPAVNSITVWDVENRGVIEVGDAAALQIGSMASSNRSDRSFINAETGFVRVRDGSNLVLGGNLWANRGVIEVDGASKLTLGTFPDASATFVYEDVGELQLSPGATVAIGGALDNSANTATAFAPGAGWMLEGGWIIGGRVDPSAIRFQPGQYGLFPVLRGVTLSGDLMLDAESLALSGGSVVEGTRISLVDGELLLLQDFTLRPGQRMTLGGDGPYGNVYVEQGRRVTIGEGAEVAIRAGAIIADRTHIINEGLIEMSGNLFGNVEALNGGGIENRGVIRVAAEGFFNIFGEGFTNAADGLLHVTGGSQANDFSSGLQNFGTIRVEDAGGLNLWGSYRTGDLGTFEVSGGGQVSLLGQIDNSGAVFAPQAGWILDGGTIYGGAVDASNLTFAGGRFDGVDVLGDLTLPGGTLTLSGGTRVLGAEINLDRGANLTFDQDHVVAAGQRIDLGTASSDFGGIAIGAGRQLTFDVGSQLVGSGYITSVGLEDRLPVLLAGEVSPGASVGDINFMTDVQFDDTALLSIELAGVDSYDRLTTYYSDLTLGGGLAVSLIDGFALSDLMDFLIIQSGGGTITGQFNGLGQDALVASFGGYDLFIDYAAGDGDDVALYSRAAAVPEPAGLVCLAAVGSAAWAARRRRARRGR